jgi:small-conductance mechanosensitive channel
MVISPDMALQIQIKYELCTQLAVGSMKYDSVTLSHALVLLQMLCAAAFSFIYAFTGTDFCIVLFVDFMASACFNVLLYGISTAIMQTTLVDNNKIYYAVLMWDHLSIIAASFTGLLAAKHFSTSSVLHKITRLWMVYAVLKAIQRSALYYLTSITIWKAYLPRIKDTVLAHEIITGLSSYAAKYAPTAEDLLEREKQQQQQQQEQQPRRKSTVLLDIEAELVERHAERSRSFATSGQVFSTETIPLHSVHAAVRMDAISHLTNVQSVGALYERIMSTTHHGDKMPFAAGVYTPVRRILNMPLHAATSNELGSTAVLSIRHLRTVFSSNANLAEEALQLLDKNGDGCVDKAEFLSSFADMAARRQDLLRTIADYESMAAVLDRALTFVRHLIMFFVILFVFGSHVMANAGLVLSFFVALSIAFGSTLQAFFEGIIFVFAVRPYDVGDRIFVRDESGAEQNYVVYKITLLMTEFRRADGITVTVSNRKLRDMVIVNAYRAATGCHRISIKLPVNTDSDILSELVQNIIALSIPHVTDVSYVYAGVRDDGVSTTVSIVAIQNQSFQDIALRTSISNALHKAVHDFLRDKGVKTVHMLG